MGIILVFNDYYQKNGDLNIMVSFNDEHTML